MSEFKGTKGKWACMPQSIDGYFDITHDDEITQKRSWIATALNDNRSLIECEANAQIISAAPELLDALIAITNAVENLDKSELKVGTRVRLEWYVVEAKEIIKKATSL